MDLPFEDNTFNVVTSFETIEHIEDDKGQVKEVLRVLKDGGLYICNWQGHGGEAPGGYPKLLELTKKGKIVWSLSDYKETGMISAVCPLN